MKKTRKGRIFEYRNQHGDVFWSLVRMPSIFTFNQKLELQDRVGVPVQTFISTIRLQAILDRYLDESSSLLGIEDEAEFPKRTPPPKLPPKVQTPLRKTPARKSATLNTVREIRKSLSF